MNEQNDIFDSATTLAKCWDNSDGVVCMPVRPWLPFWDDAI